MKHKHEISFPNNQEIIFQLKKKDKNSKSKYFSNINLKL